MKNKIVMPFICLLIFNTLKAQVINPQIAKQVTVGSNNPLRDPKSLAVHWLEIYEMPRYQGRKILITSNTQNPVFPFPLTNISMKTSDNTKVYITSNCQDIPFETSYVKDPVEVPISSGTICSIRFAKINTIRITFEGILTEIHNNDCKKMYGKIEYNVFELNSFNERVYCNKSGPGNTNNKTLYYKEKSSANTYPFIYNINDFYLADRDFSIRNENQGKVKPNITTIAPGILAEDVFVDDTALNNGRVKLEVKVKLGFAHKGCDLCSDYTLDAAMNNTATFIVDIKQPEAAYRIPNLESIQLGPLRKNNLTTTSSPATYNGCMANGIEGFSGPAHATYLQFSIRKTLWPTSTWVH
jgi:hypothetical protein